MKEKGLAKEDLVQYVRTFLDMSKKQLIVMMRYPISFLTSFGQIFMIFLIFFLAVVMFMPEIQTEWTADDAISMEGGNLWLAENETLVMGAIELEEPSGNVFMFINGTFTSGVHWDSSSGDLPPLENTTPPSSVNGTIGLLEFAYPKEILDNGTISVLIYSAEWRYPSGASVADESTWATHHNSSHGNDSTFISFTSRYKVDGVNGTITDVDGTLTSLFLYGLIMFIFLSETLWTIGHSIRDEQYQGTIESLYLTPASKFMNLVSRVFPTLAWTGAIAASVLLIMSFILDEMPMNNVGLSIFILVFSISGTFGVGFTFAALALRIKESIQLLINVAQFALMLLTAMMFPFSVLPDLVVKYVSKLIPISYSVDSFRSVLLGRETELLPLEYELVIVVAFGILMPIFGYLFYKWQEDAVRKKGTLSEY